MTRTTAAIAAGAAVLALLLAGCNDDKAAATSGAATTSATAVDNVKAGTFVVSFRSAFPKLAEGKDDAKVRDILVDTCGDIKAGKAEDDIVRTVVERIKSASADGSKEEAQAIYQMSKMLC